jgi:hypothetical protein
MSHTFTTSTRGTTFRSQIGAACALLVLVGGVGSGHGQGAGAAVPPSTTPAFSFRNVEYFHRWARNEQHEFTPAQQEDLNKWTDMVTLHAYPGVRDGEALASQANAVLENYKNAGAMVLNTNSVPRTATRPAEHLTVVLFVRPTFVEIAFARFRLADGTGSSAIYSHRIYGQKLSPQVDAWLKANGEAVEKALMGWDSIPSPAALSAKVL